MREKAIVMAATFTMLLAVGVTGICGESIHNHPAYSKQNPLLIADFDSRGSYQMMLPEPEQGKNK